MNPSQPNAPDSTSPRRSRAPEFYGFVAWTSTYLAFGLYLLWALVPDEYIMKASITWFPNREWSILVPAWSTVLVITTYIVYSSMAIAATPSFSSVNAVTDSRARYPLDPGDLTPNLDSYRSPRLYDIPIGVVNRMLYEPQASVSPVNSDEDEH